MAVHEFKLLDFLNISEWEYLPLQIIDEETEEVTNLFQTEYQTKLTDVLIFNETFIGFTHYPVNDVLTFTENISLRRSIVNFHLTDHLFLSDKISTDEGYFYFSNSLTFTEQVNIEVNDNFNDVLVFTEKIFYKHTHKRLLTLHQTLSLKEHVSYVLFRDVRGVGYTTPVNPYNPGEPCTTTIPTALTCSFTSDTDTLILLAANKGNTDNLNLGRLNKRTRGGELIQFRDPNWPRQNILNLDIPMYSCQEVLDARAFFDRNLGQVIEYTDHEDYPYQGIVTNIFEITEQLDVCFTIHIEFTTLF